MFEENKQIMDYQDRMEKAVKQVLKDVKVRHSQQRIPETKEYWDAIQKAQEDFNVSGKKISKIIQGEI